MTECSDCGEKIDLAETLEVVRRETEIISVRRIDLGHYELTLSAIFAQDCPACAEAAWRASQ